MSYAFNDSAFRQPLSKPRQFSLADYLQAFSVAAAFVFVASAVVLL